MSQVSKLAAVLNGLVQNVDLTSSDLVTNSVWVGGTGASPSVQVTTTLLNSFLTSITAGSGISVSGSAPSQTVAVDSTVVRTNGANAFTADQSMGSHKLTNLAAGSVSSDAVNYGQVLLASGANAATGALDMGSHQIHNVTDPTSAQDAATKNYVDTHSGTASSALDGTFRIENTTDTTKQIAFDASGISTATTRTITMPDSNVDLGKVASAIQKDGSVTFTADQPMGSHKLTGLSAGSGAGDSVRYEQAILTSGANAFAADQSMGSHKLTNVTDPTSAQDAATKAYVDAVALGLKPKAAVRAASTGSNITLASGLVNTTVLDGVTLATGDRVLVKDQTAPAENGIYIVAASGAASRSTDMDSLSPIDEVNGAWVAVQEGTVNAGRVYVQYGHVATLGTDAVNFEFYNPIASLIGGDMITVSGSTISVDLATVSGLESSNPGNAAGQLRVKLEASNPSLKITGSNELAVKLDPAGAITSGASGLIVGVDGSTLEINTDALRVKDAGITLAKLASNSVDENKIVSTTLAVAGALSGGSGTKLSVNVDGTSIDIASNNLEVKAGGISPSKLGSVTDNVTLDQSGAGSTLEVKTGGISATQLGAQAVTSAKIATSALDQATITGGNGSTLAVAYAPAHELVMTAGEALAANTSFLVRIALTGETAGRVYKADSSSAATNGQFWAIGMASGGAGGVSIGGSVTVMLLGSWTLGSSDSAFASGDIGKPVWLTTSGGFSTTAPSSAGSADYKVGIVQTTTTMLLDSKQLTGIA